ncbi:uncharacterized protein DC041_0011466 [Schistosoma bovis]|uniref:Uncharacterized protein n=1 Tax=Schistosoma bovis TaxID=6184 RepID=A0A430QKS3_SCHBO|nr:uncharacterized protein DC041_0011466 [Schistosoma bovis]
MIRFEQVFGIMLTYFCAVTFGAESLHRCNKDFEATMEFCFRQNKRNSRIIDSRDLKTMRTVYIQNPNCKYLTRNSLASEFKGRVFNNCPIARTYISSINRIF